MNGITCNYHVVDDEKVFLITFLRNERRADKGPCLEHLNTAVSKVTNVDESVRIGGDAARLAEGACRLSLPAKAGDKLTGQAVHDDAMVAAVGHVHILGNVDPRWVLQLFPVLAEVWLVLQGDWVQDAHLVAAVVDGVDFTHAVKCKIGNLRARSPRDGEAPQESQVEVEDLDALVQPVANVHLLVVYADAHGAVKLPVFIATHADGLNQLAKRRELQQAVLGGNVDTVAAVDGQAGGAPQQPGADGADSLAGAVNDQDSVCTVLCDEDVSVAVECDAPREGDVLDYPDRAGEERGRVVYEDFERTAVDIGSIGHDM